MEDEDGYERHLWIIVSPPTNGEMVVVCVTTQHEKSEVLVKLQKGDHPFLKWESVISYRYSKITSIDTIENAIANGMAKANAPVSEALLSRAQAGLIDSDFTPNEVRHYYKGLKTK
ncbi:MAG TPA: hypothetical protein VFA76_15835 [Terriglobales bacterium]|nr:hypothetical protein [Terriglobales bacterium]